MSSFELVATTPWLLYTFTAFFGLLIGSFLNVVILRLPKRMAYEWNTQCREILELEATEDVSPPGFISKSSACPKCGHKIRPWENLPVISFLLLKGKCSGCGKPISWQYPAVEILSSLAAVIVVFYFGVSYASLALLALTFGLIILSGIDFREQLLPDSITLPLLWLGLLLNTQSMFTTPVDAIVGASVGYLCLWLVFQLFKLITGKDGMGHGDFKLLAVFGAWFGLSVIPLIVLLSSLVGAVVGLTMVALVGHDKRVPIPFGPYLAAAGWIAMIWGDGIMNAYLGYIGIG